jgi:hypothetical protein
VSAAFDRRNIRSGAVSAPQGGQSQRVARMRAR